MSRKRTRGRRREREFGGDSSGGGKKASSGGGSGESNRSSHGSWRSSSTRRSRIAIVGKMASFSEKWPFGSDLFTASHPFWNWIEISKAQSQMARFQYSKDIPFFVLFHQLKEMDYRGGSRNLAGCVWRHYFRKTILIPRLFQPFNIAFFQKCKFVMS